MAGETSVPSDHIVLVNRRGEELAIQETATPIRNREGAAIGAVIVFGDVTKERRLKRALSYQASHDALTGLINRREFDTRLETAVTAAQRGEGEFVLLYVDLDQFKVVNDTCGHSAGDRLLRDITSLLQTRVRASDTIARLGGDEFGMLLERCSLEQAERVADSIRQAIHGYRFLWGANSLSVGASIGVVRIARETTSAASVLSAADIACYAAKDGGRNRVQVYERDHGTSRHREMQWVGRIARAVEDGRLELYAQRIVGDFAPRRGDTPFFELMVRLRDEDGSLVPPSEFIPAAERYNVMVMVDRWVVQSRHRAAGSLPRAGPATAAGGGQSVGHVDQRRGFPRVRAVAPARRTRGARVVLRDHRDRRGGEPVQGHLSSCASSRRAAAASRSTTSAAAFRRSCISRRCRWIS